MCRAIFARPVTNAAFRGGLDAITIHKAGLTSLRADVLARPHGTQRARRLVRVA